MNNKLIKIGIVSFIIVFGFVAAVLTRNPQTSQELSENQGGLEENLHPLSIEYMRQQTYPGSDIIIEQTLPAGSNYNQYIASYQSQERLSTDVDKSDGLKIYALLTVPQGAKPKNGWPVIIFNHGYIQPAQYRTTERYTAYVDVFARNGYIVFKSDYRGHGNSEGKATGGYGNNDYTIDVLNALSSIKNYPGVNPEKIGMWGHSMGGGITLRSMVVSKDLPAGRQGIKAGVIWAGVVGSYSDLLNNWRRRDQPRSEAGIPSWPTAWRQRLIDQYGDPSKNPEFWNSISANSYLSDISGPLQLHHGTGDTHVPIEFSETLNRQLKEAGKEVEYFTYEGDDHNIGNNFSLAMQRSVEFFDKYLKEKQ